MQQHNIKYHEDAKNKSKADYHLFLLLFYILNTTQQQIYVRLALANSSKKLIFKYKHYYDKIKEFHTNTRKILQLINTKLSNPQIRNFYQQEGLVVAESTSTINDKLIINKDMVHQYNTKSNKTLKFNIELLKAYIPTRLQSLFLKMFLLVKKHTKDKRKDKTYIQNDYSYIKILDMIKSRLHLNISHISSVVFDKTIQLLFIISWHTPYYIHNKTITFRTTVDIIETQNEEAVLDRLAKKTIIFLMK